MNGTTTNRISNVSYRLVIGLILLLCSSLVYAQSSLEDHDNNQKSYSLRDRIAIKTNVVDWLLITPNIAFDYDVVNTPYDKKSVGVAVKYNWNTSHTYIPEQVYNLFDIRLDYRFHWRRQAYDERRGIYNDSISWEEEWLRSDKWIERMKARIGCFRGSANPNSRISLFAGPYISMSDFSLKLSGSDNALGRQGVAVGAGLTAGVAVPLYGYEDGTAIDLEFGGSVGWHFTSYDLYRSDLESNCYPYAGSKKKWIYYPLVTDLRVSLVYRFRSIRNQHLEVNYDLLDRRYLSYQMMLERDKVTAYNTSIRNRKEALDLKNEEIAQYKAEVESLPGFDPTLSLEYLQPYIYMIEPPKKYIRMNTDTLPKINIDSVGQIEDEVIHKVIASIDSMPGIDREEINNAIILSYNSLADDQAKRTLNRTEVIKRTYDRINEYSIEASNNALVPGTFSTITYEEVLNKHNIYRQNKQQVTVRYTDSVKVAYMTNNEKIEWRNKIKKKAWQDLQRRRLGKHIRRVPQHILLADTATLPIDSISLVPDSIAVASDSANIATDSITASPDSTAITFVADSATTAILPADSIAVDSASMEMLIPSDTLMLPSNTPLPTDTATVGTNGQLKRLQQELYAYALPARSIKTNRWRKEYED